MSLKDMFSNPSSEIPDEMWRAATPMQRQADAVVLWAELTGKHAGMPPSQPPKLDPATLAGAKPIAMAPPQVQREISAAARRFPGAAYSQDRKTGVVYKLASLEQVVRNKNVAKALHLISDNRVAAGAAGGAPIGMGKAYLDYRPQESGRSNAEAKLIGKAFEMRARKGKLSKSEIESLRRDLKRAKERRENLGRTTLLGGAMGAGIGAGLGQLSKMRRAAAARAKK